MTKIRGLIAVLILVAVPAICDLAGEIERAKAAPPPPPRYSYSQFTPAPARPEGRACVWGAVRCDRRLVRAAPGVQCSRVSCSDPKE